MTRASQRGVALVITVIMVAVITFLTIAFLVLTRREKGAVTTATDQTVARLAAENALERAKADLLAPILAFSNRLAFDLRVSTNYISPSGFDTAELDDLGRGSGDQLRGYDLHWATNVSYTYPNGRAVLPGTADFAQLMANLFYNPRPPVFVKTNRTALPEFRYYLDLNRNGRHDTNGLQPVISWDLANPFYRTNGDLIPTPIFGQTASNFFVGDPEWIGILERPEFPHSSSNRFVSRFAWIAIPAGKTLDLNSVHNDAKRLPMTPGNDGFLRNQGVGPWEMNLAAFLTDLNTNEWNPSANAYNYRTNLALQNRGAGFDDASALLRYRYAGDLNNLASVRQLFGPWGANIFRTDMVDGYGAGPLMTGTTPLGVDFDFSRANTPWSGSETPEHFFTTQDFFDPAKNSLPFFNRLSQIGTNTSSYDRYTFYRLLSQLGTDSEPEPPGKMNLNYDNLVRANPVTGAVSVTNFYAWRPIDFFNNAAHRLLWAHTEAWANSNRASFLASFGVTQPFGITNIPVLVSNRFVYSASVQRLLQLAANMYDATTNQMDARGPIPSVFRPVFEKQSTNVFIARYIEEPGTAMNYLSIPFDLRRPADVAALAPAPTLNYVNVYGVPWILSARKGLPNFNEFALQTVFSIVRKLQVHRSSPTETVQVTDLGARNMDQMIVIGISNVLAVEAWNSYRSNYTRPVELIVANNMSLALTNSDGLRLTNDFTHANMVSLPAPGTNFWAGTGSGTMVDAGSFIVPLRLNIRYPAPAIYRANPPGLNTNLTLPFERSAGFPQPRWGVATTNRLRFILRDRDTKQLLDFVQMIDLDSVRDLSSEIAQQVTGAPGLGSVWDTNRVGGSASISIPTRGINNQIHVSLGDYNSGNVDWTSYGFVTTSRTKNWEIDNFRAFFKLAPLFGNVINNTNLVQQVPFTPALLLSHYQSWQANDPLVHYTPADLRYLAGGNQIIKESVKPGAKVPTLKNIGLVNERYHPWGGYPPGNSTAAKDFNLSLQDPLVRSSDDWDFPANKLPNVGWLGRVHRGTPWQTVYLKSSPVDAATWLAWSGNDNIYDAAAQQPVSDRLIFDLFTTALSDTATRGQMSINQSGLAAWSAIFGGVLAVTNTTPDSQLRLLALQGPGAKPGYSPHVIEPAGAYAANDPNTLPALVKIVNDINLARATNRSGLGVFTNLGDVLSAPALAERSPFLNVNSAAQTQGGLSDAAYERLPQQVMSLLSVGGPRFVIYGYGQALRPADNSVVNSRGPFFGLCTNYQITAEVGIRAVVRVDGAPANPHLAVESFNVLPPD